MDDDYGLSKVKTNNEVWILKRLKEYGNCYIGKMRDIPQIEKELGQPIKIEVCQIGGYVLTIDKKKVKEN